MGCTIVQYQILPHNGLVSQCNIRVMLSTVLITCKTTCVPNITANVLARGCFPKEFEGWLRQSHGGLESVDFPVHPIKFLIKFQKQCCSVCSVL